MIYFMELSIIKQYFFSVGDFVLWIQYFCYMYGTKEHMILLIGSPSSELPNL